MTYRNVVYRKLLVTLLLTAVYGVAPCGIAYAAAPLNIWLDVPFVKQQKNACGEASIAMVMQYWERQQGHAAVDPAQVLRAVPPGKHGMAATDLLRYFQQHGYRAFAYVGEWADLEHQLTKGRPLIVALKPDGDEDLHYAVVAGVDEPEQVVLLNDPAQRKLLKEDRRQFEREWKATGNWTLLAVPAEN